MMREVAAKINNFLAWIIFLGTNLQFVLIALSVFGAASSDIHAAGGFFVWLIAILAFIAALVARASRLNIGLSFLTALLIMPVQGMLVHTEFSIQAVHALHAVNGLAILYLSYMLANGRARATFEEPRAIATTASASD
jgi:hypothetical protein